MSHDSVIDLLPADELQRFTGNPILLPIPEHPWESKYVFNAGTIRLGKKVYLLYRAHGDDDISRIGLAVSVDGFTFNERLEKPIFEPVYQTEKRGCEDPRLVILGDRIFMTYTAYDGNIAQIAIASISVHDFLHYRWESWERHGLFLPGQMDKDAIIFPDEFNGKIAMIHRFEPHIWITFSSDLRCPWPSKCHKILALPSEGEAWDSKKIGAGAQPIKTKYGWLLITHGVDYQKVYRLGVILLDLENPTKLIYRSPNHILEPATEWELGHDDYFWVPNVVFSCGAVPMDDKDILNSNDELIVYYGGADTVMNIATATIGQLIPEKIRETISIDLAAIF
jgi:predicted GH43/DUF377 family glycosyl hydrolase